MIVTGLPLQGKPWSSFIRGERKPVQRTTRLLIENRKNRTSQRFHIRNNTKRVLDRLEDVYSLGP
jgi:hypothetical protein